MFKFHTSLPKISCLMVTATGRFDILKRSYQCYLDQIYANRELVIVTDGTDQYKNRIFGLVADRDDVRLVFLNGKYTLGALRNISVGLSHGDLFTQWDDDDFNAPERLAVQCAYLLKHPKARMCFLGDQLHYYFATHTLYWNNWEKHSGGYKKFGLIPGTILARTHGFPYRYPSSGEHAAAGEDSMMTNQICEGHAEEVLILKSMGYLHVYSFHGQNVWDIEHHMEISKKRSVLRERLVRYRESISRSLDYFKFHDTVNVVGMDGLAFTWSEQ
jgi:glycosyltransferase involved in cell wall biosynthesis